MPDAREKVARWTGEARIGDLLLAHYRLRLEGAVPVGGVIRLDTRQGSFALKRAGEGGERRWREVEELGKHLFAAKAIRIPIPLRTRSGRLTFAGYVHNYVLLPWIAGKPIAFARPRDFQDVSRGLARLHEGARGFPLLSKGADIRASWIRLWEKAIQRMGLYRVAVEWSGRSVDVDSVLRDAAPYAEGMITNALQYLHRTQVDSLSPEVALQGRVCHGNLHGGNLLRDEQGSVRFIDWNRMAWDARARDVAQWLLYAYGRTGDLDLLGLLLQDYQHANPLREEELYLIYALFLYPHRLVRVLDRIYGEQSLPPNQAASHLMQAVSAEEKKFPLLRGFPHLVKETFGRSLPRVDWLERVSGNAGGFRR